MASQLLNQEPKSVQEEELEEEAAGLLLQKERRSAALRWWAALTRAEGHVHMAVRDKGTPNILTTCDL